MLLIQNGRVLDPYTQMDALCDVLIGDDGVIAQVAERGCADRCGGGSRGRLRHGNLHGEHRADL